MHLKVGKRTIEIGRRAQTPATGDSGGESSSTPLTQRVRDTMRGLRTRIGASRSSSSSQPAPRASLEGLAGSNSSSQADLPLLANMHNPASSLRSKDSSDPGSWNGEPRLKEASTTRLSGMPPLATGTVEEARIATLATPQAPVRLPERPSLPAGFETFTDALKSACAYEFQVRRGPGFKSKVAMAAANGPVPPELTRQLNEAGAQAVHETIRQHFKGQLKSGNKTYSATHQANDPTSAARQARRIELTDEASKRLNDLRDAKAPLEDFLEEGVAACGELSALSVVLARDLGLKANIWSFVAHEQANSTSEVDSDEEDAVLAATSHAYCLIGEVPSLENDSVPAGKYDVHGKTNAPHLFAVDAWTGICCPSHQYNQAFDDKMEEWDRDGKLIQHEPVGEEPRWMRPTDTAWKNETTGSTFQKRKDTSPDRMYRPE
jgi:hypothetical protein